MRTGAVVLLMGMAALLCQQEQREWRWMPLPARLASVALLAITGLGFGWQQRHARYNCALALQGGMIALLMATLLAAYRHYALISSDMALCIGILLITSTVILAIVQHARILAQLAVLSSFAVPVLLAAPAHGGNSMMLFSYYILLDVAIAYLAWIRPWRELNLMGFIFTYGIAITWGILEYTPEYIATIEPFLWLFFFIYLILPLLYAHHASLRLRDSVHTALLFGTPLVTLILQSSLVMVGNLPFAPHIIALSALVMSGIYAVMAVLCFCLWGRCTLSDVFMVLAATLITVAVPLTFGPGMTGYIFAIEGAGLVWLGLREQHLLSRLSGFALQLYAAGYLAVYSAYAQDLYALAYMHALIITVAACLCAWLHYQAARAIMAQWLYGYALLIWSITHGVIITNKLSWLAWDDGFIVWLTLTSCAVAWAYQYMRLPALSVSARAMLILCGALTLGSLIKPSPEQVVLSNGVLLLGGIVTLRCLNCRSVAGLSAMYAYLWLLLATRLSLATLMMGGWSSGVPLLGSLLPWLMLGVVLIHRPGWLTLSMYSKNCPNERTALPLVLNISLASLAVLIGLSPCSDGLPWLPILNPAELGLIAALMILRYSPLRTTHSHEHAWMMRIGAVWIVNVSLLHTLHHWAGIPWDVEEMLMSGVAQLSFTLLWSLLGVAGWVMASRGRDFHRWRIFAIIQGVILAKLIVIDRFYLDSPTVILLFIGYGLMCIMVGFIAPIPPRRTKSG